MQLATKIRRDETIRNKRENATRLEKKEWELINADRLFTLEIQRNLHIIKTKENEKRLAELKGEAMDGLIGKNFSHSEFMIIYDIFSNNYEQIEIDIKKERIYTSELEKTIQYIEGYSEELINQYKIGKLLSL